MTPKEALERAIAAKGSQTALAEALSQASGRDIKTGHIFYWLKATQKPGGEVPSEHCPDIEAVTGLTDFPVTCEQLCPSVRWGVLRVGRPKGSPVS
jgi:DNA-binding transcriptional regulator YdaS (Cro superfamily)